MRGEIGSDGNGVVFWDFWNGKAKMIESDGIFGMLKAEMVENDGIFGVGKLKWWRMVMDGGRGVLGIFGMEKQDASSVILYNYIIDY